MELEAKKGALFASFFFSFSYFLTISFSCLAYWQLTVFFCVCVYLFKVDAGSKATTPAGKNKSRVRKSKTKLQPPPPPPPLHEVETLLKSSAALGKYVQPCLERGLILVIQLHRLQDSFLKVICLMYI